MVNSAAKHHEALRTTNFVKVDEKTLGEHKVLPFSSAKDTSAIADSLLKQLKEWKGQDTGVERKLAELQSLLLKSELIRTLHRETS